jgi:hypothetical protein
VSQRQGVMVAGIVALGRSNWLIRTATFTTRSP